MDVLDQHYNDKAPITFEFEGTPDEFVQACLAYSISNKIDSYPYKWIQTKNPRSFVLYHGDPESDYYPVSIFASPLPNSRALLTFKILSRKFDEYKTICQKLVNYLIKLDWIKPKSDSTQEPEHLPNNKLPINKNNPRIDAVNRVAVALYAIENGEIPTYSSAAKRFKTHPETINKYSDNPSVLKKLEEFRKDPAVYQRCRQMVSKVERRK